MIIISMPNLPKEYFTIVREMKQPQKGILI